MAATKYIGYLGGAAVAAGVGAAIAVAGAATANADAAEPSSPESAKSEPTKPLDKLADRVETIADRVTKAASPSSKKTPSTGKPTDAVVDATQIVVRKPKPTPEQFEAEQVERLKGLFQGAAAAPEADGISVQAAEADPDPNNPFRADDPPPVDVPESVVAISTQVQGAVGPDLAPYAREAVEQGYRGTQMIPWVNAVVPITKIVPSLGAAIDGDTAARQLIVNELIKTTPPGSFVYYGYDLVADLTNQEAAGAALKDQVVAGVWDLLDPTGILHPKGQSGIGNALG
jgi:hypothetical protein